MNLRIYHDEGLRYYISVKNGSSQTSLFQRVVSHEAGGPQVMKREFQEAFLNLPSTSELSDTEKSKLVNVVFVGDEWNSCKGGLSTFNREFAINIAILDVTSPLFLSMTSQGLGS